MNLKSLILPSLLGLGILTGCSSDTTSTKKESRTSENNGTLSSLQNTEQSNTINVTPVANIAIETEITDIKEIENTASIPVVSLEQIETTELPREVIVSNGVSMSVIPREATGEGDYYLAPTVKFSKLGPSSFGTEEIYVDENGENHYGVENIFLTEFKTFGLNIDYSTENSRDNYSKMGHWRHNYSSQFDFDINPEDIKDKSNFYDTPREACEHGFSDLKETMYRGVLSTFSSVYNKDYDTCSITKGGQNAGEFIVWDRSTRRDDIHYVTMPKGEFLIFKKNKEGTFISDQNGLLITLNKSVDGSFSFKDAKDFTWKYDTNSSKLISLTKEGETSSLEYDKNGKLLKVKGIKDNVLEFTYNANEQVEKVSWKGVGVEARFDYSDSEMLASYKLIAKDENNTDEQVSLINFDYNDKNLLVEALTPKQVIVNDDDIEEQSAKYGYDELNRVNIVNSNNMIEQYTYGVNDFTRVFPNGKKVGANIDFIGSRQVISSLVDSNITSTYKFNKEGRLSELVLVEAQTIDSNATEDSSNIQSNAVVSKSKLTINIDYNNRGLINSHAYETSEGVKKMASFEYKTAYNKPTKVLTQEDVTFFDFNNKGQLQWR